MAESIKLLENLPASIQEKIMEKAQKDYVLMNKGDDIEYNFIEEEIAKTLPLELNGVIYEIPAPVWYLIEKLGDLIANGTSFNTR